MRMETPAKWRSFHWILVLCTLSLLFYGLFSGHNLEQIKTEPQFLQAKQMQLENVIGESQFKKLKYDFIKDVSVTRKNAANLTQAQSHCRQKVVPKEFQIINRTKLHANVNRTSNGNVLFWYQRGRLGNFLFQFGASYCIALSSGRTHTVQKSNPMARSFPSIPSQRISDKMFKQEVNKSLLIKQKRNYMYQPEIYENATYHNGSVILLGYFENWKYILNCESEIRTALRFPNLIQEKVDKLMNTFAAQYMQHHNVTQDQLTFISIHVRRTDRKTRHPLVPASYLFKAMKLYNRMFRHPLYFLASDDIRWCKKSLESAIKKGNVYVSHSKNAFQDFVMIASCHHSILTVGTFGYFAAWLHRGNVIYYNDAYKTCEELNALVFSDWIPLGP